MLDSVFQLIILASWIYLVWMVRKKRIELCDESHYKWLKRFLIVGGVSLAGLIVWGIGIVVYNAIWGLESDNHPGFWIGLSLLMAFIISTIGSWVIFLIGRRKGQRGSNKTPQE